MFGQTYLNQPRITTLNITINPRNCSTFLSVRSTQLVSSLSLHTRLGFSLRDKVCVTLFTLRTEVSSSTFCWCSSSVCGFFRVKALTLDSPTAPSAKTPLCMFTNPAQLDTPHPLAQPHSCRHAFVAFCVPIPF